MNWEELRKLVVEKNKAAGAGVFFDPFSGSLSFFSEGDPHTLLTYENFERVYQMYADGRFT